MDKEFAEVFQEEIVVEGKIEELGKQIAGLAHKFKEGKDDVMTMADEMITNGSMPDPEMIKMLETEEADMVIHLIAKKMGVQWTKDNGYGEMRFKQNYPESTDMIMNLLGKKKDKIEEASKSDIQSFGKKLSDYAKKRGGIDKDDFKFIAKEAIGGHLPNPKSLNRMDTEPREVVLDLMGKEFGRKFVEKEYGIKFNRPTGYKEEVEEAKKWQDYLSPEEKKRLLGGKRQKEGIDIEKASMGDVIKDFQTSDAPQFKGKSDKKRKEMAIAAKLSKEENEDDDPVGKKKKKSNKDVINLKPTAESSMKKFKDIMTKLKEKRFNVEEEVEVAEKFAGWIAIYGGKQLEIKKSEADGIWPAKQLAIKHFKVPKSKLGLLAIAPAHEEVEMKEYSYSPWLDDEAREVEGRPWKKKSTKDRVKWLTQIKKMADKNDMDQEELNSVLSQYGLTKFDNERIYDEAQKVKPKWKRMSTSERTRWVDKMHDLAGKAKTSDADVESILDDAGLKIKESVEEATGDKEAYQKFFNGVLKKFGVKSPSQLKGDKKKEFFDYIDKNWTADHEEETKKEETMTKKSLKDVVSNMKEKKLKVQEAITIGGVEVGEQEFDKEARLDHVAPNLGMTYKDYQAKFQTDGLEGPYQIDGGAYFWDKAATKWFSVETEDYVDDKRNAELNFRYTKQGTAGGGLMHNRRL